MFKRNMALKDQYDPLPKYKVWQREDDNCNGNDNT